MNRILILLITIFPSVVFADELDTGDTAWILVSTALVLFMKSLKKMTIKMSWYCPMKLKKHFWCKMKISQIIH